MRNHGGDKLIRECIADPERTHEIREYIAKGHTSIGSQTFDQALVAHYRAGLIDDDVVWNAQTHLM